MSKAPELDAAQRMRSRELFQEIKDNHKKLDGCPRHSFPNTPPPYSFGQKVTCLNCGGVMNLTRVADYTRGYKAAGGNPNVVFPGWE